MCKVVAGPEDAPTKTYYMHKGVLSFYSAYFATALSGTFIEAKQSEIRMKDVDVTIFDMFQYWLYSQRLPPKDTEGRQSLTSIMGLWIFADANEIPALQNAAIDWLHQEMFTQWRVPITHLSHLYEATMPGSLLRRFYIDAVASITKGNTSKGKPC